jgi:pyrroloquinoline quinone biosynthesis protein B
VGRQIEKTPSLQPKKGAPRNSPIAGVLLTNADLDHVLGLIQLREGEFLPVMATRSIQETLDNGLGLSALMGSFCALRWIKAPPAWSSLRLRNGIPSGLTVRMIPLPGKPPRYAETDKVGETEEAEEGHSVAYHIGDENGARLLIAPDVAALTPELQAALEESDAILFDGTFWSWDELHAIDGRGRFAREMGHLPIQNGSLPILGKLRAPRKIFMHINNTNPILAADSPERAAVLNAGIIVGEDAMEFTL